MERELGLFLNNPGEKKKKKKNCLKLIFHLQWIYSKDFQSKIHENIRRHYFQTWLTYELAKNPPGFFAMIKKKTDNFLECSAVCKCSIFWLLNLLWSKLLLFFILFPMRAQRNLVLVLSVMSAEQNNASSQHSAYQHRKGRGDSFSGKHCKLTYTPKKICKNAKVKGSRNMEQGLHFLRLLSW